MPTGTCIGLALWKIVILIFSVCLVLSNDTRRPEDESRCMANELDDNLPNMPDAQPKHPEKELVVVARRKGSCASSVAVDKDDPFNWSWKRKHMILITICYMSFMTDFLSGYGVPLTVPQSKYWGISETDATRSISGNTFMQGIGSVVAVPFVQRYGTHPVMFWSTFMALAMTIACAVVPGWIGFIAVRVLQGFFATTGQVLGLTVIQDIFYFEEHARKVGIWGWSILIGPYFGPFLGAFIVSAVSWRQAFWIASGIIAVGLVLVVFAMDETTYDRRCADNNPQRPAGVWKRKAQSLVGVTGHRMKNRPSLATGATDVVSVLLKPQFLLIFLFHGLTFCWSVGINGSLIAFLVLPAPKGYGFDSIDVGLMYIAPMTAVVLGELFGHFYNDWTQLRSLRKNRGVFQPESRLWAMYFSIVLMVAGLSLLGVGLQHLWHWGLIAVFWGVFIFAAMTSTVVASAYVLDCFPSQPAAGASLLQFSRVLFGFLVPLFQTKWAAAVGAGWSFGTQALICLAAFGMIPVLQRCGRAWRERTGEPAVIKVPIFDDAEDEPAA